MATLLNGDCLEVMKTLKDKSIDCFICDLPYGCLTGGGGKEKAKRKASGSGDFVAGCAWDIPIDLAAFWVQVKRLAKNDHTPVLMFCTTRFGYDLIKSNESWFRYDIVWEKTNGVGFLTANKMPLRAHEMVYVFCKKGAFYNRVDISGDFPPGGGGVSKSNCYSSTEGIPNLGTTKAGRRCVKSVVKFANKKTKGGHPTAKPIDLYKWLIERYCPLNGTILDPTAGSFNCIRAALELKRRAIGIEKDAGYFNSAKTSILPDTDKDPKGVHEVPSDVRRESLSESVIVLQ